VASIDWPSAICDLTRLRGWYFRATPRHLRSVPAALERAAQGLEDYLGRGLTFAAPGVEGNNSLARRLYQRLGYQASGRRPASWQYQDDDGVLRWHEATLTMLRKRL